LTPIQAARISVTAYPIIQVDMLAVIKCVLAFHVVHDLHMTPAHPPSPHPTPFPPPTFRHQTCPPQYYGSSCGDAGSDDNVALVNFDTFNSMQSQIARPIADIELKKLHICRPSLMGTLLLHVVWGKTCLELLSLIMTLSALLWPPNL
jgi:hypothetical protein